MRYSIDREDPGHEAWRKLVAERRHLDIFLDDARVGDVITCDDEEGFVLGYVRSADGRLVRDGDRIAERRVEGRVRIEVLDG
jgi:hypothetical protein